jgi:hypothetical protein
MTLTFFVLVLFAIMDGKPVAYAHPFSTKIECEKAASQVVPRALARGATTAAAACHETPKVRSTEREA